MPSKETARQIGQLLKKHGKTADAIYQLFIDNEVSPQDGEKLLIILASISLGRRSQSLVDYGKLMATAWVIAASGDEDF